MSTYLFKISGKIGAAKHKEFEQTVRFVFNMLPASCLKRHLAADVFNEDLYHLFTVWESGQELAAFKDSDEFSLIRGSFQALGAGEVKGYEMPELAVFKVEHDL